VSWEKAAAAAVKLASQSLRDLRVAEVTQLDMTIVDGKVGAFRAKVNLSFKYESSSDSAPARRSAKAKAPEAEPEAPAPKKAARRGKKKAAKG
jgi:flavin-binding protein dodecin